MISRRIVCRDHVGRSAESKHLLDRRRAAARGRGGLVLVRGEPGIGKSRLLAEFAGEIRPPTIVAHVECRPFAQLPLAPLDDLLGGLLPQRLLAAESLEERIRSAATALESLAERSTVVALVEDLHWAHPDFLEVVAALAVAAASRRLLIVATYRAEELGPSHAGFATLGRLVRNPAASVVELEPLDAAAIRRLLIASVDEGELPDDLRLAAIARRCGGNPLFAEELLRDAIDGAVIDEDSGVPLSIRGIVAERLGRCSARELRFASAAALAGRRFRLDVLARLGPDFADGALAVQKLCDLQLVDADASDAERFVFRHALVRDAIASMVPPATRGPLHGAIAAALAARADSSDYALEIAYHHFAAGEREPAAFARAGAAARANLDFGGAIVWYERAADAAARIADRALEIDARIRAATAAFAGEDAARGERILAAVIARANAADDRASLVRASRLLAGSLGNDGRHDEGVAVLASALRRLGDDRRLEADMLRVRLAGALATRHDAQPLEGALATVDATRLSPRSLEWNEYHALRAQLAARRYDLVAWRAEHALTREGDATTASPSGAWLRFSFALQAWESYALGDLRGAGELLERAAATSRDTMGPSADVSSMRAICALATGDVAACARAIDELPRRGLLIVRRHRTIAALGLGCLGDDREALARALDPALLARVRASGDATAFAWLALAYAEAEELLGRSNAAREHASEALDAIADPYGLVPSLLVAARLEPEFAARAEAIVDRGARASELPYFVAARELASAERRRASDRPGAAAAAARAGAIFEAAGWRRLAMRARELSGDVDRAAALARDAGDVPGHQRLVASGGGSDLSEREREIAALVARGETNRKIAAMLSISEKTVEKHLTSIYQKLALRSRTELAVTLTKR